MKQRYSDPSWLLTGLFSLLLFLGLACPRGLHAQSYQLPAASTVNITTCSGTLYDNGGASGPYTANASGVMTITPATVGNKIRLQFTSIDVDTGNDWLYIYDGSTVNAPLIGAYNSTNQPGTVYATSALGALTVRLTSDGVGQLNGFAATIGCVVTVPMVLADLTVQGAVLYSANVVAGGSLTANCSVYNVSGATVNTTALGYYLSSNATLDASDQLLSNSQGNYPLPAGQYSPRYATITVPSGTAPGTYYILFVADYLNQVSESNETNNVMAVSFTVAPPGVDLVLHQEQLHLNSVMASNSLQVSALVLNQGNMTANSSTVGYYLSADQMLDANDVLLNTVVGGTLPAAQNASRFANLMIPTGTTAGNYYVLFVADPQNTVVETNETNNVASQPLTVLGPFTGTIVPLNSTGTITSCATTIYDNGGYGDYADNANGALSILPGTPGMVVQLTFTSFGTEPGFDFVRIFDGASINAPLLGTYSGSQLPLPVIAANADGALTVQFVSDNYVSSSGFTATVSCVTAPQSDLMLTQIGASPSTVAAGGSLSLTASVANQGAGAATNSAVGYYLSRNQVLDAGDRLLGTSEGAVLGTNLDDTRLLVAAVPANVPAGAYYVLFVADPLNEDSETDETNNLAALPLTVTQVLASHEQTAGYTVRVLPNPVVGGGLLRVQLSGTGANCAATLELYNTLGQHVRSQPLPLGVSHANQAELSTQNLAAGVYILRLIGPGLSLSRRVVIE